MTLSCCGQSWSYCCPTGIVPVIPSAGLGYQVELARFKWHKVWFPAKSRKMVLLFSLLLWGPSWHTASSSGVRSTGNTWTCWNGSRGELQFVWMVQLQRSSWGGCVPQLWTATVAAACEELVWEAFNEVLKSVIRTQQDANCKLGWFGKKVVEELSLVLRPETKRKISFG